MIRHQLHHLAIQMGRTLAVMCIAFVLADGLSAIGMTK